jgi:hypothetical protein
MEWAAIVAPLVPTLVDIVKEAIEASPGDEKLAIGILMGILGSSEENKTRAAMVLARAEALREFGPA